METAYGVLDLIWDLVREAETRALMGERIGALCLILRAQKLLSEFEMVVSPFPDFSTLTARIGIIANQLSTEMKNGL